MNERQDPDRGDEGSPVPPVPAEQQRVPVTHSLSGSIVIDLDPNREEDSDG